MGTSWLALALLFAAPQEEPPYKLPPPAWITLKADNRPLNEVLQEISRQASIPIDCPGVADRVTVNLGEVPFWEALHEVCTAHGFFVFGGRGDGVLMGRGKYSGRSALFRGPLAVLPRWDSNPGAMKAVFHFLVYWEKKVPMDFLGCRVISIRDGGEPVPQIEADTMVNPEATPGRSQLSHGVRADIPLPLADPDGTPRYRVVLRCGMAVKHSEIVFKDPEQKADVTKDASRVSVTLVRCARERRGSRISYQVWPGEIPLREPAVIRVMARDENGVEHFVAQQMVQFRKGDRGPLDSSPYLGIPASLAGPVKELKFLVPDRVHVEEVTLDPSRIPNTRGDWR